MLEPVRIGDRETGETRLTRALACFTTSRDEGKDPEPPDVLLFDERVERDPVLGTSGGKA